MATSLDPTVRRRLRVQGYAVPTDEDSFASVAPWLRFAPALCSVGAAVGTVTASPWLLLALVPFAALGAVSPVHPFDHIYERLVRRVTGTGPLPPAGRPRRFACVVATVWLVATAASFWAGATLVGYVLGGSMVAVSGLVATTHVCIPSMVYRALFREPVDGSA